MTMPGLKWLPGGKGLKPLPMIMVVTGIGLVVVVVSQQQTMRGLEGRLAQSRQQVQQLEAQHQAVTQQMSELEEDRQGLDARVKSLRNELTSVSANLDRSRLSLEALQGKYDVLNVERSAVQAQLSSVTAERDEARREAKTLEQGHTELERSVSRLRERLTLLDRDYRQLTEQLATAQAVPNQGVSAIIATGPTHHADSTAPAVTTRSPETVELPPIIVRRDQAGMSIPVRGRVVEVNEPHRFIVVDQGSMDGVHVGMAFDIVRGASTIGRATVVRVRPQLSACDILRAKTPGPLQTGDQAVQSGSGSR